MNHADGPRPSKAIDSFMVRQPLDPVERLRTSAGQRLLAAARSFPGYPGPGRYALLRHDSPDFIWFMVPKVGSRSIVDQLEANGIHEPPRYNRRYAVNLASEHFAFTFVRNPWDRLVSCWRNRVLDLNKYRFDERERARMQDFHAFVEWVAERDLDAGDDHLRRQKGLVDVNRVDFVGRFEQFADDASEVFSRLGLRFDRATHHNRSWRRYDYRDAYSDATAELVGRLYEVDVRTFGYRFDP